LKIPQDHRRISCTLRGGGKTDHLSDCSAMRFSDIKVTKKGFHLGNFSILVF